VLTEADKTIIPDPSQKGKENSSSGDSGKQPSDSDKGAKKTVGSLLPQSEKVGRAVYKLLDSHITEHGGTFLRGSDGSLHLLIEGKRTKLCPQRDEMGVAGLLFDACNISSLTPGAQAGIQRLVVEGYRQAGWMRLRNFSALSDDHNQLYVPIEGGKLLQISPFVTSLSNYSPAEITEVANGKNHGKFWLEHPCNAPFHWKPDTDGLAELAAFERLLVETQACSVPAMCWFVAMALGLFPYVRETCLARLILVLIGSTQAGKTSGAQRFTLLHGLGPVKGDYSTAGLAALGDIGLLVLDNKEQANFYQSFVDFLLFAATGAERGRAYSDGALRAGLPQRPVCVITSIEGVVRRELMARTVNVAYGVPGPRLRRGPLEREIKERRGSISSALMLVLQRYMQIKIRGQRTWPNPVPEFEEHFSALCDLLQAFEEVAGKPEGWAAGIVNEWNQTIFNAEIEGDALEQPLRRIIANAEKWGAVDGFKLDGFHWNGENGKLYVTSAGGLLTALQQLNIRGLVLPQTPEGLGRRLRSSKFNTITVLDCESAPNVDRLKRSKRWRPIGLWVPREADDDSMSGGDRYESAHLSSDN
jgi:hypothetical protein